MEKESLILLQATMLYNILGNVIQARSPLEKHGLQDFLELVYEDES